MALITKVPGFIVDETTGFTFANANVTGNLTTANANLGNTATANYFTGVLTTGSQPNITSLGTLSSLTITANVATGGIKTDNIYYANGSPYVFAAAPAGSTTQIQYNNNGFTSASANLTFNPSTNTLTVDNISANGFGLSSIQASNVSGAVANATYSVSAGTAGSADSVAGANVSGQVSNAAVAGTVYTAAQPNITSVGTLSSLAVTGNITSGNASITGTTASTSKTTGALTVAGGVGISNDLAVGNSITVDNGSYGNVVITQFASIFATGSGPNPRAIYQATGADGVAGIGMQAVSSGPGQIYANTGIIFTTGATIRDKDYPTGGTTRATLDSTGLTVTGIANISGNITSVNANLGNLVTANFFTGSGNLLSNIQGSNISGAVSYATTANSVAGSNVSGAVGLATYATTANSVAGANVSGAVSYATTANSVAGANVSGQVSNALVAGTVYTVAQPNITSVGTLTSLDVTGNITGGNANLGNAVKANYFVGSAAFLTGVDLLTVGNADIANSIANGNSNISTPIANGNITVSIAGVSNTVVFTSTGTNVNGTLNVTGNASVGNLTVTGTTTTVNSTVTRVVDPIFELGGGANGAALTSDDNKDRGLLLHYYSGAATVDSFIGWDDSNAEFAFGSNVSVASEVVTFNTYGNIRGNYILGNGAFLTGVDLLTVGNADAANYIANGTSNVNTPIANGNITVSIGGVSNTVVFTTTGINVAGKITSGTGVGGNITGANLVSANYFTGTLTTAAQPNITSVGTLTSLAVTGNITAGNANLGNAVTANYFIGNAAFLTGVDLLTVGNADIANSIANGNSNISTPLANGNITVSIRGVSNTVVFANTGVNIAGYANITGNITGANANLGNLVTANYFSGNGSLLTALTGANVSGAVSYATTANAVAGGNVSGAVSYATTANAVAGSNVSGAVSLATYATTANSVAGANVSGQVSYASIANSVAVANVGGIGNIATVNLDGNSSNVLYGNGIFSGLSAVYGNSNVTTLLASYGSNTITTTGNITANYFIGNGSSLTGISATTAISLINGNSNVIVTANANVTISAVGNANVVTVTGTGANISGYANITGNLVVGAKSNLGPVANVTITGGTTGQYLKTDGTGNLSWDTVSGGGGGGGTAYTAATTPPASGNTAGAMWYNTATDVLYEYISDGTNSYWVDVQTTTITASNTTAYVSRSYTANGSGTTYTVTEGANVHNVLVYLNGIAQLPTTDYTISGSTLTFDSAPSNSTLIYIRELMPPLATTISQTIGNLTVATTANTNSLNVTANTTTSNLSVTSNLVMTGVSNLGAIGNVKVTGGTNGQFISTDGTGNLTFTSVSATRAQAVIMGIVFGG